MKRVLVVQRRMTHYRVPFFEALRADLQRRSIELVLAHGRGTDEEESKADSGSVPWAQPLATQYLLGGRICYQPLGAVSKGCDMMVVALENKLVCNLWHQFLGSRRVALWGHGGNLQGDARSWRERFKRVVARRADWWFGYTEMSRPLIGRSGFPQSRVTILNNSVDTAEMTRQFQSVTAEGRAQWRLRHGIGPGPLGIFLGSLYSEKRIDFLLRCAAAIREQVPGFEIALVGAGPQRADVEAFCAANPWAHFLGMQKGQDKVDALAAADVMLNPGLVGLGILDSFTCGVPMLTTDCGLHSPEIAYLASGENGLMTPDSEAAYVSAAVALLNDRNELQRLRDGCLASARQYTVENMARNFADGVEACLAAPRYRGAS